MSKILSRSKLLLQEFIQYEKNTQEFDKNELGNVTDNMVDKPIIENPKIMKILWKRLGFRMNGMKLLTKV